MKKSLIEKVAEIKGATFLGITYTNKVGEKAKYVVNIKIDYGKAKKSDLAYLKSLTDSNLIDLAKGSICNLELMQKAKLQLIDSFESSLNGTNKRSNEISDVWETICPGVRKHKGTSQFQIYGFKISKHVLVSGEYKTRNRQKLTVAKDIIRKQLKTSKFRPFYVNATEVAALKGETFD